MLDMPGSRRASTFGIINFWIGKHLFPRRECFLIKELCGDFGFLCRNFIFHTFSILLGQFPLWDLDRKFVCVLEYFAFLNRILYFPGWDIWEGWAKFYGKLSLFIFPGGETHCMLQHIAML